MEKKKVYVLSDSFGQSGYHLDKIEDVKKHLENQLEELGPGEQFELTVDIIEMTEEEFDALPEYEF
jgi:hypothetical protein